MTLPWALSHKALASLARVAVSVLEASANESASLSSVCDDVYACGSCTKRVAYSQISERW
jgi:ferredoxin